LSQLPNLLSVFRLFIAPLISWLILTRRFDLAILSGFAAGVSDWLDGYAARLLNVRSKSGAYLDPLADKILLVAAFVSLGYIEAIPWWLVCLALLRDLVIATGVFLLWWLRGYTDFPPLMTGKVSTFLQICLVIAALLAGAFPSALTVLVRDLGIAAATVFTVISGYSYIRLGIRMAPHHYTRS
jgi:cardiolipin synthase (CMP-forming)